MPDDEPKPKTGIGSEKQMPDEISTSNIAPGPQPLDILKTFQEITHHAREEFYWVRSVYKHATLLVAVFIILIGFLGYSSYKDFRQKIEEKVNALGDAVTKRVEKEFEADNIKRLVETKAKERINLIADKLIQIAVDNRVEPVRSEMISMIKTNKEETKGLLKQADQTLAQVQQQSEFILSVLAAQGDDRKAYDQLGIWEHDSSFPLRHQAAKARLSIQRSYAGMFANKSYRPINLSREDLEIMTFSEIINLWQATPSDGACAYIYLVQDLTNITQNQKHSFLFDILSDSRNSLQAGDLAASILAQESNIPYTAPLNFGLIKNLLKDWIISNTVPSNVTNTPLTPVVSPKK